MNTTRRFALAIVGATLLALAPNQCQAAAYQIVHAFNGLDGYYPQGNLTTDGTRIYGVTAQGGTFGAGTVYGVNTNGSGFLNVHSFFENGQAGSQGNNPQGGLLLSGTTLYGSVSSGTRQESGGHFGVNIDGTGYFNSPLDRFNDPPFFGNVPAGDRTEFSVMGGGGLNGNGTIRGPNLFPSFSMPGGPGAAKMARAGVVEIGNRIFGTASQGGASGNGAIFALNDDGSNYQILHSFNGSDGYMPTTKLTVVEFGPNDTLLFGTTQNSLFLMNPDGSGFTTYATGSFTSSLTFDPTTMTLYGTEIDRVFSLDLLSGDINTLHTFADPLDGIEPQGGVIPIGPWLYGTTSAGGEFGNGTLFRLQIGQVPEPGTVVLAGMALGSLLAVSWRRRKRASHCV